MYAAIVTVYNQRSEPKSPPPPLLPFLCPWIWLRARQLLLYLDNVIIEQIEHIIHSDLLKETKQDLVPSLQWYPDINFV